MSSIACIHTVHTFIRRFVTYLYRLVITIIDVIFKAVIVAHNLLSIVFTAAFDFLLVIIGLLNVLVLVIRKSIVLLGSVCYLAYQCIKILIYFLIHHAILFFPLLTGGASNCKETLVGVWKFTKYYSVFLVKQVIAGVTLFVVIVFKTKQRGKIFPSIQDNLGVRYTRARANFGLEVQRSTTHSRLNVISSKDFQKEIEKEKEKTKCVVCQDHDKSVLILPCKHLCLCFQCGTTIAKSTYVECRVCPLCRGRIETIMTVYT